VIDDHDFLEESDKHCSTVIFPCDCSFANASDATPQETIAQTDDSQAVDQETQPMGWLTMLAPNRGMCHSRQ
jgi:hypothetical protein